jgi:hypothetical protein
VVEIFLQAIEINSNSANHSCLRSFPFHQQQHHGAKDQHQATHPEIDIMRKRFLIHLSVIPAHKAIDRQDHTKNKEHETDWNFYI